MKNKDPFQIFPISESGINSHSGKPPPEAVRLEGARRRYGGAFKAICKGAAAQPKAQALGLMRQIFQPCMACASS
jgi:hypothetical protein